MTFSPCERCPHSRTVHGPWGCWGQVTLALIDGGPSYRCACPLDQDGNPATQDEEGELSR